MPKHKPIRFQDPSIPKEWCDYVKKFIEKHPVASSMSRAVLALAIIGGAFTVSAVAPGLAGFLNKTMYKRQKNKRERYRKLWERFYALRKRNIFEYVGKSHEGELIYKFSKDGQTTIKKFLLETLVFEQTRKWDGKWRVIVFDIPEKFKWKRRLLQQKMLELGFYPLQKSVMVHPFPCDEIIHFLKDFLEISPYVELFVVNDMPNGKAIYHFKDLLKKVS